MKRIGAEPNLVHEKTETAVELDEVDLVHLPWGEAQMASAGKSKVYQIAQTIHYHGEDILLRAKCIETSDTKLTMQHFAFTLGDTKETINGTITINYDYALDPSGNGHVKTSIRRNKEKDTPPHLPPGVGITLYEQMLKTLQQLANDKSMPLQHYVTRFTEYRPDNPLTINQWNEKFIPVLQKFGYEPRHPEFDDGKYKKTYQPGSDPR
ncbi:MAG: hypothetical protein WCV88_03900 [Patescibacteria group bacterium]|jgi:hypothetical protein